jgi:hypothetical protein
MQLQKAKAFRLDLVEKCVSDEEIRLRGEMLTLCLNSPTNCMRDKTGAPCISLDPQGVVNLLSQYGTSVDRFASLTLAIDIFCIPPCLRKQSESSQAQDGRLDGIEVACLPKW